jgi:transposase-like protein
MCKKCGSTSIVKNGFVRGLQRYRSQSCGFNFTATPKCGPWEATKALAVLLHSFGKSNPNNQPVFLVYFDLI